LISDLAANSPFPIACEGATGDHIKVREEVLGRKVL
jgi:hypothetical protein